MFMDMWKKPLLDIDDQGCGIISWYSHNCVIYNPGILHDGAWHNHQN
jgi:hypothetical protein